MAINTPRRPGLPECNCSGPCCGDCLTQMRQVANEALDAEEPSFEQQVLSAMEASLLKFIGSGDWIRLNYNERIVVSTELLRKVYSRIDMDRVAALLQPEIEKRIADTVIHGLATELATDVKKIMSNQELREDLRAVIREKIRSAASGLYQSAK